MITIFILILLIFLLAAKIPVAFALFISGSVGLSILFGPWMVVGILESTPFSAIANFELLTIPMFILMGSLLVVSGISDSLFKAAAVWIGRTKGGLAIATAVSGAAFGAISGSSTAAAATLSSTSIPAMIKQGYERRLAAGVVAISGTLAMLIPPSIGIIFYGVLSETSISKLLIASILPGLVVTAAIILTIMVLISRKPELAPTSRSFTWREKLSALKVLGPFLTLFALVTGTIYLGIATPVEASALGAFGAFAFALAFRSLTWRKLWDALASTARITAMLALIVIAADVFSTFLALTQTPQAILSAVAESGLPTWGILLALITIYLIMGCFLDLISILVLTIPVVMPLVHSLGIDPIWFGVIVILTAEIGLVTPPVGLNVFVVAKYTKIPVMDGFYGVAPHVLAQLLVLGLLCAFPAIATWLPSFMD
ncbi:TRAP transporter large permease [Aquisalimonas lutea]|uniref:TRAP transporter large permease n=1 Tax=Aquisalimonas lutea TaxID=1327750 RepID=UPI0025B3F0F0|nr:TRAP transporter large permease [Aquisalimonas lutea]MDN3519773.1 TRAP transporter large permease [Aquisalimonas lutea]